MVVGLHVLPSLESSLTTWFLIMIAGNHTNVAILSFSSDRRSSNPVD